MHNLKRMSGILLHPTSLPSPYGIGDLGEGAFQFIDFLEAAGQHLWQTLPLTHTGFGDSPYQGFSAFAGQPLMISPKHLADLGLLSKEELLTAPATEETKVAYGDVIAWKKKIFHLAYERYLKDRNFKKKLEKAFQTFSEHQSFWLDDYALFMALKDANEGLCWLEWDEKLRLADKKERQKLSRTYEKETGYYKFLQFFFFTEWNEVKSYANERDIKIIGDIPIFVSMDSADVWANQGLFQLDSKGYPTVVAGVPPDYFSETGQLWGNPLYDWDAHKADGFSWWISRVVSQLENLDILRIDHFRGFEAYWAIPYGEETAINGKWVKAPGTALFSALSRALGDDAPIIAEDLGVITEEVEALRDQFEFPGMKVLQFAFDSTEEGNFLPHNYQTPNCVCYTGTHDNDTSNGWYQQASKDSRKKVQEYTQCFDEQDITRGLMRASLGSIAAYSITPLQDILHLGSEGRMNLPGSNGGNWSWRFTEKALTPALAQELRDLTKLYGRLYI